MNARRAVVLYSLIRLGMFAVVFAGLLVLFRQQMDVFTAACAAAVCATLVSFSLSYIFLRRPRDEMAKAIHARRSGEPAHDADIDAEDAAVDARDRAASSEHESEHEPARDVRVTRDE